MQTANVGAGHWSRPATSWLLYAIGPMQQQPASASGPCMAMAMNTYLQQGILLRSENDLRHKLAPESVCCSFSRAAAKSACARLGFVCIIWLLRHPSHRKLLKGQAHLCLRPDPALIDQRRHRAVTQEGKHARDKQSTSACQSRAPAQWGQSCAYCVVLCTSAVGAQHHRTCL